MTSQHPTLPTSEKRTGGPFGHDDPAETGRVPMDGFPHVNGRHSDKKAPPLKALISSLADDLTLLVRKEIEMAKLEVAQRFSQLGHDASLFAGGAVLVAGGLVLVFAGLAYGVASIFQVMGASVTVANLLGFVIFGSLSVGIGYFAIKKAKHNLVPDKPKSTPVSGGDHNL